jgi:hypothetical protein
MLDTMTLEKIKEVLAGALLVAEVGLSLSSAFIILLCLDTRIVLRHRCPLYFRSLYLGMIDVSSFGVVS